MNALTYVLQNFAIHNNKQHELFCLAKRLLLKENFRKIDSSIASYLRFVEKLA
jgi:hypothetical protein